MDDIDVYLKEDLGDEGDVTSESLFDDEEARANIIAKQRCVVAGLDEAKTVFERIGAEISLKFNDGEFVKENAVVTEIKGPVRAILKGERMTYEQYLSEYDNRLVELASTANTELMIVFCIIGLLVTIVVYEFLKKTIIKILSKNS